MLRTIRNLFFSFGQRGRERRTAMVALLRTRPLTGLAIREALGCSVGTLYPDLRRLEREGKIRSWWGSEQPPRAGGYWRRYYYAPDTTTTPS